MEMPASPLFEQLLQRAAVEHSREVDALRAEIERLRSERTLPSGSANGKVGDAWTAPSCDKLACYEAADEKALAAAFAAADDDVSKEHNGMPVESCQRVTEPFPKRSRWVQLKEQMPSTEVLPTQMSTQGSSKMFGECSSAEGLALWHQVMRFVRHEVYLSELPAVHPKWNVQDPAFNLKTLVGGSSSRTTVSPNKPQNGNDNNMKAERSQKATPQSGWNQHCLHLGHCTAGLAKRSAPTIPMSPTSSLRVLWDCMGVCLLIHDLIMTPLAAFEFDPTDGGVHPIGQMPDSYKLSFMEAFDIVSATFWTCDIVMSFLTAYHSNAGMMETRMTMVAVHYIKSWFPIDASIVAVDLSLLLIDNSGAESEMKSTESGLQFAKTVSRIMRFTRLLRFAKMSKHVSALMARINSEYVLQIIGLLRLLLVIIVFNHYIACAWFYLTRLVDPNLQKDTWVTRHFIEKEKTSLAYCYFSSLHWSLTQFTPASMEIFPRNEYERMFNVVIIMLAFVFFSSFVSSITSAMTHIRNINAQAVARDTVLRRYFSENSISHGLAAKVWHFVRQKRVAAGRKLKTEDVPILQQLPVRIRDDLRCEVYSPILKHHPLLHFYIHLLPPAAIRKLCKKGISERALATAAELKLDEDVRKMIFVVGGTLEFHMHDSGDDEEGLILEAGDWACELALWADKVPVDGQFIAAPGGADVVLLDADVFRSVAIENFDSVDVVVKYSGLFLGRFREAMQDPASIRDNLLFNHRDVIKDLVAEVTAERRRSLTQ